MDHLTSKRRSWNMSLIRSVNTKPELVVRQILHSLGYRFRLHRQNLPGKPDIVLKKYNTVIFVHGCFWHQHKGCKRSNIPKSNVKYWKPKLSQNVKRDKNHKRLLRKSGWKIITIWECEGKHPDKIAKKLSKYLV
ncbi:MAG: DNA mismatch endonuclease Vsr [Deltaproteobacteria bacterium]|nr:DNA mismatch endonuclease Vsr [Deltaproteobacteria bacterium]